MTSAVDGWRALDQRTREREYSPSSTVASLSRELVAYAMSSARARAAHPPREIAYGAAPAERLDLFVPTRPGLSPLLVFIHGGYWQELGKSDASFLAPALLERGAAYAAVGYPLAPRARLGEIVGAVSRALDWLSAHAAEHGIDRTKIHLAGSSAGACLAAELLLRSAVPVASATLLSGIYDLRPLVGTSVNDALGLDEDTAWEVSPARSVHAVPAPIRVAWGAIETAEFKRQGNAFADALAGSGCRVRRHELAGRNHFDNVFALTDPDTDFGRETLAALEVPAP